MKRELEDIIKETDELLTSDKPVPDELKFQSMLTTIAVLVTRLCKVEDKVRELQKNEI